MNARKRYALNHPTPAPEPEDKTPQIGILSVILLLLLLGLTQCIAGCPPSNHNHGVQPIQQCGQWKVHVAESGPTISLLFATSDGAPQSVATFSNHTPTPTSPLTPASPPARAWFFQHDTGNMVQDPAPTPTVALVAHATQTVCLTLAPEDSIGDPCLNRQAHQGTLCFEIGAR